MPCTLLRATVFMMMISISTLHAAEESNDNGHPDANSPAAGAAASPGTVPVPAMAAPPGLAVLPGYPYLNAPLNPTPRPDIPYQVGSSVITNQAFAPHEMLYPHKYRAMYPPYYHKVRGHWVVTPWGIWSREHWHLQGTEVKVNYRSRIPFLSKYTRPWK